MTLKFDIKSQCLADIHLPPEVEFLQFRGSILHGTYRGNATPETFDDIDLIGFAIPGPEYFIGLKEWDHMEVMQGPYDIVVYDIKRLISLLLKGNPNVIGMLYSSEDNTVISSPAMVKLRENREIFLSKRIISSFIGYAMGQLKRMTNLAFEGYMGQKRKALASKYGYDTKNAAHCVRLLTMGIEFLQYKSFRVDRQGIDSDELLSIKGGKYTIEEVNKKAEALLANLKSIEAPWLPESPNLEEANKLCVDIIRNSKSWKSLITQLGV